MWLQRRLKMRVLPWERASWTYRAIKKEPGETGSATIKKNAGRTCAPGDKLTSLRHEAYDFGEAAGLAFAFFAPFSAVAAFASMFVAVIV